MTGLQCKCSRWRRARDWRNGGKEWVTMYKERERLMQWEECHMEVERGRQTRSEKGRQGGVRWLFPFMRSQTALPLSLLRHHWAEGAGLPWRRREERSTPACRTLAAASRQWTCLSLVSTSPSWFFFGEKKELDWQRQRTPTLQTSSSYHSAVTVSLTIIFRIQLCTQAGGQTDWGLVPTNTLN